MRCLRLLLVVVTLTLLNTDAAVAGVVQSSALADHAPETNMVETNASEANGAETDTPAVKEATDIVPVVLSPPYSAATPLPIHGRAMYYNPGVMGKVLAYRLKHQQVRLCGECVGYAALMRAGDLNRRIWLQWEDGSVDGPFLVIDVAAYHHIPLLLERNWVVDLDYRSAQRRGMNRPLPVTVLPAPPGVEAAREQSEPPVLQTIAWREDAFTCHVAMATRPC